MKRHLLLAMLLLMGMALLGTNNIYAATSNQQNSVTIANTNIGEISEDAQNCVSANTNIQKTTVGTNNVQTVRKTVKSQQTDINTVKSASKSNHLNNSSKSSVKIQKTTRAAGDEIYKNVHGIWLSVDDVKKVSADELKKSGITDVFVKANRISAPLYPEVLKTIIDKLDGSGLRVHAWITCFVDKNGNWYDPKSPSQRKNLLKSIADITKNYEVDGIMLDYVRYPGTAYKHVGATNAITSFVASVTSTVKSIKPKVAISAALMPEGAANSYYYGQDYSKLSNYLDFLVPMVYNGNYKRNITWVSNKTAWISQHSNGKPVIVGLQTYKSDKNLSVIPAAEIRKYINSTVSNGASGYALFRYGWLDKAFFGGSTKPQSNAKSAVGTSATVKYTVNDIKSAASRVKAYIESNKRLPNYVNMGARQVTMPQFLRLLTAGLLQVNRGSNGSIILKSVSAPSKPTSDQKSGNISKSEYIAMAGRIISFMDTNGKAPNYASSSLGKIQYETLVYMYSRIMNFYGTNNVLPNYATTKPWQSADNPDVPAELKKYLQPTRNCQSNDSRIKSLASSITQGATTKYDKAVRLFNWVRDNIGYTFYYDTRYGALGTLNSKTANCVDTSHLLAALSRAAGIPAKYVHGVCKFSSGTWYGHVWTQIYVNGKWYNADAISYRNSFGVINNWDTSSWTLKGIYAELPF